MNLSDFAEQNNEAKTEWKDEKEPEVKAEPEPEPENPEPATSEGTTNPADTPTSSAPSPTSVSLVPTKDTTVDDIVANITQQIAPIGQTSFLKILVYGEPGSGKSSFSATAPNNLIYDLEDGLVAAKQSPNGIADNVRAIPFESWDQSRQVLAALKARPESLEQFEVFSIDTLSELHKRGLAEVTEREFRKRPSANRYVAETEHHTENNERIVRFFRALRDLDRHLIVIAHSRTVEPKNKPAKTFPDFSESLSNKIMAFMDVVVYMEMRKIDGKIQPVGRFISDGKTAAKNRIGLPEEVVNPTFPQIKRAWENTKD